MMHFFVNGIKFFILAIIGHLICTLIGDPILALIKTLPYKFFLMVTTPIAKEIPNYEAHSVSNFAGSAIVIILGAFILNVLIDMGSSLIKRSRYKEDSKNQEDSSMHTDSIEEDSFSISIAFNSSLNNSSKEKFFDNAGFLIFLAAYIIFHAYYLKSVMIFSTGTETMKKIEIVAPYIEDTEYKKFKSQFYTIECWKDYEQLDQQLDSLINSEKSS